METQNDTDRRFSLYAEFKKGTSYKFYEVEVTSMASGKGGKYYVSYGRIGTKGRKEQKDHGHYDYLVRTAKAQMQKKLDEGYIKVAPLEALASSCSSPEEMMEDSDYEQLTVPIPVWATGNPKADKRLTGICSSAITKLNLNNRATREASQWDYSGRETLRDKRRKIYRSMCRAFDKESFICEVHVQALRDFYSALQVKFGWGDSYSSNVR